MNVLEFIRHPDFINDQTLSPPQEVILKAIYGLPLTSQELEIFLQLTGWPIYPKGVEWAEITAILPRRSGKTSQLSSNLAIFESCGLKHKVSRGTTPTVMIVASEKGRQARICFNYIFKSNI